MQYDSASNVPSGPRTYFPKEIPAHCHIPQYILQDQRLTDFEKILFGRLRGYAGEKHYCFVKVTTLMEELCKSRRVIYRAVESLVKFGYLYKYRAHPRATTNYYFIITPEIDLWLNATSKRV